jgi:cell division transport system ATP-binding protein
LIQAKVGELLAWAGLESCFRARPDTLSGGQKQRAAIARAVITAPDIVLADEPSGNLDAHLRHKFMHLFTSLQQSGATVLYATHDEALISAFDYPVYLLENRNIRRLR